MAKKGLGRGLGALLGDDKPQIISPVQNAPTDGNSVCELKLVDIEPNRDQPRKEFDEEKLSELAESIRQHGVISPIIVKRSANGFYSIIAGERRWRAAKKAGLKTIPAIVKELSEIEVSEIALIENLQRQDLNPVEEALGYKRLMDEYSLTQEQIAEKMSKSRSSVANALRLLNLADDVLEMIKNGKISFGHAKLILSLSDKNKQSELAKIIADEDLSVRATEQLLKQKPTAKKTPPKTDLNLKLAFDEIAKSVSTSLGAKVRIAGKGDKGTIQIEYYSKEELERIVKILNK